MQFPIEAEAEGSRCGPDGAGAFLRLEFAIPVVALLPAEVR